MVKNRSQTSKLTLVKPSFLMDASLFTRKKNKRNGNAVGLLKTL